MSVTKNLRDGTMWLTDGDSPANQVEIALASGNLTFEEGTKGNVINVDDRGSLSHMRQGNEVPVTGSFGTKFVQFIKQSGGDWTIFQIIRGDATDWVTTNDDGGDVFTIDIRFFILSPTAGEQNELITITKVTAVPTFSEADEYNELNYNFQGYTTAATIVKTAASS